MRLQFDIVDGVANSAFLHVNSGRSRFLARAELEWGVGDANARVGARSDKPLGLQLIRRSSCTVRLFPVDPAFAPTPRFERAVATRPPPLGMSIAQPRGARRVTQPNGVGDAGAVPKARDGHE